MPFPPVTDRLKEAPAVVLRAVFAGIGQLLMAADKVRSQLQEQLSPPAPERPAGQAGAERPQVEATGNVTVLHDRQGSGGQRAHTRPARAAGEEAAPRAPASKPTAKPIRTRAATQPAATKPDTARAATKPPAAKSASAEPTAVQPAATRPGTAGSAAQPTAAQPTAAQPTAAQPRRARAATRPTAAKPSTARATTRPAPAKPTAAKPAPAKPAEGPATASAAAPTPPAPASPPVAGYDDLSVASLRARLRGLDAAGVQALLDYEQATARRSDVITMYERRLARLAGQTG